MYALPRPALREKRCVFDEDGPPIVVTLRELDGSEVALAGERAQELIATYITGDDLRPPSPFPDEWVKLSRTLIYQACVAALCQSQEPRYDELELMVLSNRRPHDWAAWTLEVDALTRRWQEEPGKSRAARTESSSALP